MPELQEPPARPPQSRLSNAITQGFFIVLQVCKQGTCPRHRHSGWGRKPPSSQYRGSLKEKPQAGSYMPWPYWIGRGIVGSKSSGDFCNFPQSRPATEKKKKKKGLFNFWLTVLKFWGSQAVFGPVVAFLWIQKYMGWGSLGGAPARVDFTWLVSDFLFDGEQIEKITLACLSLLYYLEFLPFPFVLTNLWDVSKNQKPAFSKHKPFSFEYCL